MKPVKASILTALALGALMTFGPVSQAQENNNAPANPPATGQRQRRGGAQGAASFDRMAERLKLTDDQKAKLRPISNEENTKLRALREDQSLSNAQRREKAREIRDQYAAKMKPILTTEQFDELKKLRQQTSGRGPRGVRQSGGAAGGSQDNKQP